MTTVAMDSGLQLTEEQIARYRRDGVVHVKGFLDLDAIEQVREAIDKILQQIADGDETRKMVHVWRTDETFRQLCLDSAGPRLAAQVTGAAEVQLLFDHLLVKEPNTEQSATLWHHDLPYWPVRGEHICTIWVPFDHVTMENGSVEYAKSSHQTTTLYRPAMPPELTWGQALEMRLPPDADEIRDTYEVIHFDTEPGDCLLHHPLVLHGGPPNKSSDARRRAVAIRYAGEDTHFVGGGAGAPIMSEQEEGSSLDATDHPIGWPRQRLVSPEHSR